MGITDTIKSNVETLVPSAVSDAVGSTKDIVNETGSSPMPTSEHHHDVAWCRVGDIMIMYHAGLEDNVTVNYDEQTIFGSHGQYAVWSGTTPRNLSLSANLVGANTDEVVFNMEQVNKAYKWTQESPPRCKKLKTPFAEADVRVESMSYSVEEGTYEDGKNPVQITLTLGLKECRPI